RWFLLHWFSLIITLTGIVTLLLARGHYSIDVLIAYYITTRVWWIYHTLAHNQNLRIKSSEDENYLSSMWWFPIFQYFEKVVPAKPLRREYSLPIPNKGNSIITLVLLIILTELKRRRKASIIVVEIIVAFL
ncbi:Phosphatidylcholine:ceramide cholinephosphotransferase 1like, partial [Caligus rogercresseyi]